MKIDQAAKRLKTSTDKFVTIKTADEHCELLENNITKLLKRNTYAIRMKPEKILISLFRKANHFFCLNRYILQQYYTNHLLPILAQDSNYFTSLQKIHMSLVVNPYKDRDIQFFTGMFNEMAQNDLGRHGNGLFECCDDPCTTDYFFTGRPNNKPIKSCGVMRYR